MPLKGCLWSKFPQFSFDISGLATVQVCKLIWLFSVDFGEFPHGQRFEACLLTFGWIVHGQKLIREFSVGICGFLDNGQMLTEGLSFDSIASAKGSWRCFVVVNGIGILHIVQV